jgi:hypothetical protein
MAGQANASPNNAAGRDLGEGIEKTPDRQERAVRTATYELTSETHGNFAFVGFSIRRVTLLPHALSASAQQVSD